MPRMTDKMVKTGFQSSLEEKETDAMLRSPANLPTEVYSDRHFLPNQCWDGRSSVCISLWVAYEDIPIQS